ncbi:hypothetical protein AKJ16_DCAP02532 [Drosera capensis]
MRSSGELLSRRNRSYDGSSAASTRLRTTGKIRTNTVGTIDGKASTLERRRSTSTGPPTPPISIFKQNPILPNLG